MNSCLSSCLLQGTSGNVSVPVGGDDVALELSVSASGMGSAIRASGSCSNSDEYDRVSIVGAKRVGPVSVGYSAGERGLVLALA